MANKDTQFFEVNATPPRSVETILQNAYEAMVEKGYNPVNQIVGYIMSGDPVYITGHKNARNQMVYIERDEIVEELLKAYITSKQW